MIAPGYFVSISKILPAASTVIPAQAGIHFFRAVLDTVSCALQSMTILMMFFAEANILIDPKCFGSI